MDWSDIGMAVLSYGARTLLGLFALCFVLSLVNTAVDDKYVNPDATARLSFAVLCWAGVIYLVGL